MDIQEIKAYMKKNKISYEKLAEMTGLSVSTITKIFGGFAKYPRVDTIETIERALGLNKKNTSPELSDEESELLALFGKMSPAQKARFVGYGEGLLNERKEMADKTFK